ncbi:MAG: SDR family NAD(P)-dependent oxidoreductase, partial [Pedobacter sp.]
MQIQKIALVTGGNRGLGKNMALALAKKGVDVILTYNSKQAEADEVVSSIEALGQKAVALQFDAGNVKSFDGFINQVKNALTTKWNRDSFDFLINNAGIGIHKNFAETTE